MNDSTLVVFFVTVALSIVALLAYALAVQLVRTNDRCYSFAGDALAHALSINDDAREHMRMKLDMDRGEFLLREAREKARIAAGLPAFERERPPERQNDVEVQMPADYPG